MGFERKLNDRHTEYIKKCLVSFVTSPTQITRMLGDEEIAKESGFTPVKITVQRISKIVHNYKNDETLKQEIADARAVYLLDFSDLPLYHSKERVKVLEAKYHAIRGNNTAENPGMKDSKGAPLSDRIMLDYEMRILRQISEESGENLEKIAAILAQGNSVTVNLTLKDRILGHYEAPDEPK